MQQGKIVKKVVVYKRGERLKPLFGRVGIVHPVDQNKVEIIIDGRAYTLQGNTVELLPCD